MAIDPFTMLVAVDLDDRGEIVLAEALRLARRMNAIVDIVHVAPPDPSGFIGYEAGPDSVRDSVAKRLRIEHRMVHELREKIEAAGVTAGQTLTIQAELAKGIIAEAKRFKPDILVIGHGRHSGLFRSRSLADEAIEELPCTVMVVPTTSSG
jgi:nucleotide-binding universal stress UspA family protein